MSKDGKRKINKQKEKSTVAIEVYYKKDYVLDIFNIESR